MSAVSLFTQTDTIFCGSRGSTSTIGLSSCTHRPLPIGADKFTERRTRRRWGWYRGQERAQFEPFEIKPVIPGLPGLRLPRNPADSARGALGTRCPMIPYA